MTLRASAAATPAWSDGHSPKGAPGSGSVRSPAVHREQLSAGNLGAGRTWQGSPPGCSERAGSGAGWDSCSPYRPRPRPDGPRPTPPGPLDRAGLHQPAQHQRLVPLPRGGQDHHRLAAALHPQVQLGGVAAAAAAQRLPIARLVRIGGRPPCPGRPGRPWPAGAWCPRRAGGPAPPTRPRSAPASPVPRGRPRRPATRPGPVPDVLAAPPVEAAGHRLPGAELARQVPPRRAGAVQPHDRLDDQVVVLERPAHPRPPGRQQRRQPGPLRRRVLAGFVPWHEPYPPTPATLQTRLSLGFS